MEYRKLISFGKSSFVISLPKAWIRQNKIEKGDLIYLEESGTNIILSKTDQTKVSEDKKIIINVDGKTLTTIKRELVSAYILNNRTIVFKGKETKTKLKELQSLVQNLIALEIMEQDSNTILAKDFLNMDKVSLAELIRKMDLIIRTMINETTEVLDNDLYETINERDTDVNRLYFLLKRAVLYNLKNPVRAQKNFKLNPARLLNYQILGTILEGIADETRRTARFLRKINFSNDEKKEFRNLLNSLNEQYLAVIKTVYTEDSVVALENSQHKNEFNILIDNFETKFNKKIKDKTSNLNSACEISSILGKVLHRMRKNTSYIHNLGRVVYTL